MKNLEYKIANLYKRASLAVNIDITNKCVLECTSCQRQNWRSKGKKIPGNDMSIRDFKKIIDFFPFLNFCGTRSDPVHHPKFLQFLKLCNERNIQCVINNASSAKSKEWYIKAFKAAPNAKWIFGIDGLPKDSHKYRINQDGEKLFNIMVMSKNYLNTTPTWQYIVFSYNENNMDEAKAIANDNGVLLLFTFSNRFDNHMKNKKTDVIDFKPKNEEHYVKL